MMNLEQEIKFLKEQKVPIEEIRLLEILKKEEEWNLLSKKEKQNKRKFAISFLERASDKNINIEYEKNVIKLYDIGENIIHNTMYTDKIYLKRLCILVNIQQDFIDEMGIKNLYKIRKVDINIIENLFKEIKQKDSQEYRNLNLDNYLILFEKVCKKKEYYI